ncbi:MAG: glycosyltransferase family 2 protein [Ruminococcus sp.]|uniref:glycosyltransferase family 2 protein n=1 Tax=Ruminococcus sp. TaxID=41978 RepID=UPI0025E854AD|nr:glycosyltransferase family 2 protein [Ruminococcus sp.]MCR4796639.1 glycosyltransferase family 2 protein [Ruminococcus sp.]
MENKLLSIVLQNYHRIENLKYVLKSLSELDFNNDDVEIIVCSYEYSDELYNKIQEYSSDISISVFFSNSSWNISKARNNCISLARGKYIVFIDADILCPVDTLNKIMDFYNNVNSECMQIGFLYGYDERTSVEYYENKDYSFYQNYLQNDKRPEMNIDYRFENDTSVLPWAFCWTAFVVVPREKIIKNNLFFDEGFTGWGAEDIEWAYRIYKSGIDIEFNRDIWAIHLPHKRDSRKNFEQNQNNYYLFLKKANELEVEMVGGLGDIRANRLYYDMKNYFSELEEENGGRISVAECLEGDKRVLYVGVIVNTDNEINDISFSGNDIVNVYNLIGFYLPYTDNYFDVIYTMPLFDKYPEEYKKYIFRELNRLSGRIIPALSKMKDSE